MIKNLQIQIFNNEDYYECRETAKILWEKYFSDKNKSTFLDTFIQRMKKIKENKNILNIGNKYYIKVDYFKNQINIYENSIKISDVKEFIESVSEFNPKYLEAILSSKYPIYKIEIIGKYNFINKNNYIDFKEKYLEVINNNCITSNEIIIEINKIFLGYEYKKTNYLPINLVNLIKEENLKIYNSSFEGNLTLYTLYPQKTAEYLLKKMSEFAFNNIIYLNNIDKNDYLKLNKETLEKDYYTKEELLNIFSENNLRIKQLKRFNNYISLTNNTNIKTIGFKAPISNVFYSKKEVDSLIFELTQYISFNQIREKYGENYIKNRAFESLNIETKASLPLLSNSVYVKIEDFNIYVNDINFKEKYSQATTIFDKVNTRINYFKNKNEYKLKNLMNLYFKYLLQVSNNSNTKHRDKQLYDMYNFICDNFTKDINFYTDIELKEYIKKLMLKISDKRRIFDEFISFIRFLNTENEFKGKLNFKKIIEINEEKPYSQEEFLNLILVLIDIVNDEDNIKKILFNFSKSSVLLYVFLHLCMAWRRGDLIENLPNPNLNLIKYGLSPEELLSWINEGNRLDEKTSILICSDIEEKVNAFRLVTNKTQENLTCIIPKVLAKDLALLICINYANKILEKKNNKKLTSDYKLKIGWINKEKINQVFLNDFNIDLDKILTDGFRNRKANKSYLTLIVEKSEEFGLMCGYYYAQKLRSHRDRFNKEVYSNTTKIYIDKDVNTTSVMAFALGSMGSIKYNLVNLITNNLIELDRDDRVQLINSINLAPSEIENIYKNLADKSNFIQKILYEKLNGSNKNSFLQTMIYGNNVYAKHENTKCLFKILKSSEKNIESINVDENINCPYRTQSCIGCNYLIAMRFFTYEFEKKFNSLLEQLNNSNSSIDKEINIKRFTELYLPLILDMQEFFGKDTVRNMLNVDEYKNIVKKINGGT